ncbi:Uncharacterized protein TCM_028142 [Theobroma cacao]|uniref:Uncharacterized protein n=1 Tax=Theobroma cacao TaxID=3641 RepID=A0A061GHD2_THECC|nr:Uncharacterized protein TCM_028142 [Theobroma cacao]
MQEIGSFEACLSSNVNDQSSPPNSGTGTRDKASTMAENSDGTGGNEAMNNVADKNSKNISIKLPTRVAMSQHGDGHQLEHVGVEIEVHPLVRRKRHSDTKISIDKIFSLTSDKAVDIRENDEASDEDSISVNFAASWECERYF